VNRGPGPRRDTPKARAWANSRKTPVRSKSLRRTQQELERAEVRAEVHQRAGGVCQYAPVIPEIQCASPFRDRPQLEVDELRGGAHRSVEWLNPDACRLTCQAHHDWKTEHKPELLRRLAVHEGRTP
jgi:hypothetical protein